MQTEPSQTPAHTTTARGGGLAATEAAARDWLGVALGSLLLGGLLSLMLVVGRVPIISQLIQDPFFVKKSLIVHVNLTLGCWSFAMFTALFLMIPGAARGRTFLALGLLGIAVFVASGFMMSVDPVLSNFFPAVDHPLFLAGISVFLLAVSFTFIDRRLLGDPEGGSPEAAAGGDFLPQASQQGLRVGVAIYFMGMIAFAVALALTSRELDSFGYYNTVFWGVGHIFQLVNVSVLISVWLLLLGRVLPTAPLTGRAPGLLFGALLLAALGSLYFLYGGPMHHRYVTGFVDLMRWGTWPVPSLVLLAVLAAFIRQGRAGALPQGALRSAPFQGFLWSAILLLLGFALGAMISGSNTLIPAHYHATIGSVTVAYMAASYLLLERFGMSIPGPRLLRLSAMQPAIYGLGQVIFVIGFAYAGMHGLGRKNFGNEQTLRSTGEVVGLGIAGLGGLLAVVGGGLFLYIAGRAWFARR
ncbi:MAG: hypothetical protein OEZ59_07710 [Deltaproteobacteria bacterium]|nr:hypothetical protein [Deltaproteobacteria bacterium]